MPRLSDSMEEGTVLEWLVAEGDPVRRGQSIVEIETDKASMPYEAQVDGVLLAILCQAGETAPLGRPIAIIGEPGEKVPEASDGGGAQASDGAGGQASDGGGVQTPTSASVAPAASAASGSPAGRSTRVAASPVARRVAEERGVDLATVQGTGPGGRVVRADVEAASAEQAPSAPVPIDRPAPQEAVEATSPVPPSAETLASAAPPEPAGAREGETARGPVEVQALSRLQRTVARRMAESRATVPEFELRVDVDMAACTELRQKLRELGADPLPSLNDMVVKASAAALREFPRVNAAYRDGNLEQYGRIGIGIAVAAEDTLVVPVVADADRRSLGDIARTTRSLAGKVRDGSVTPPELAGATFTVSNLGMFGIDSFSAVINMPQAAILAVGAVRRTPVAGPDDEVVVRPVATLTLACDHRVLYGADGARFLARLRELLEQPLWLAL